MAKQRTTPSAPALKNPPVNSTNAVTDLSTPSLDISKKVVSDRLKTKGAGRTGITRDDIVRAKTRGTDVGQEKSFREAGFDINGKEDAQQALQQQFNQSRGIQSLNQTLTTPGAAQERLAASAEAQTQAQQQLLNFLKQPQQSLIDQFKSLREASGRSGLVSGRTQTLEEINRVKGGIESVRANLREQGGAITNVASARQEARHLEQVRPELTRLQGQLEMQSGEIKELDGTINQLLQFGQTDRANELKRLASIASTGIISEAEKELLKGQIKTEVESAQAEVKAAETRRKDLNKGLSTIRDFATREGVITGAFGDTINEAVRRLEGGEDPQTILADVAAAVNNNPVLKRKLEAEIKRKEQLAAKGAGGSGAGTGITEVSFGTKPGPQLPGEEGKRFKITKKNGKIIKIEEATSDTALDALKAKLGL